MNSKRDLTEEQENEIIEKIKQSEIEFKKCLDGIQFQTMPSEVTLLLDFLGGQNVKIEHDLSRVEDIIFIMDIFREMESNQEKYDKILKIIVRYVINDKRIEIKTLMTKKIAAAKIDPNVVTFKVPKSEIYLQKIGKLLKKLTYRQAFLTKITFGQTDENRSKMIKPSNFMQNTHQLESKKNYEINLKKREKNKDEEGQKLLLVWPKDKKYEKVQARIILEEIGGEKRARAIYFEDEMEAKNVSNSITILKLLEKDRTIQQKLGQVRKIWKVGVAERFYKKGLVDFFHKFDKMIEWKKMVKIFEFKLFPERKFAENPFETINSPELIAELREKALASVLNERIHRLDSLTGERLSRIQIPEGFEFAEIDMRQKTFKNDFDYNSLEEPVFGIADFLEEFKKQKFCFKNLSVVLPRIDFLLAKCSKMLKINQIIIQKVDLQNIEMKEPDVDNLEIDIVINKPDEESKETSISPKVVKSHSDLMTFEFNSIQKTKTTQLKSLSLRLVNKKNQQTLLSLDLDLIKSLKTFELINEIVLDKTLQFCNSVLRAKLVLTLVLIPRNLEICHLILNEELIALKYQSLAEILSGEITIEKFKNEFWNENYIKDKIPIPQSSPFACRNLYLPAKDALLRRNLTIFQNSQKDFDDLDFAELFKNLSAENPEIKDMFGENYVGFQTAQKEEKKTSQKIFIKIFNGLSPVDRLFLYQLHSKIHFDRYFAKPSIENEFMFDRKGVDQINDQIEQFIKKNTHWKKIDLLLLKIMVIDVYFSLISNKIKDKNVPFYFNDKHITIIAKTVEMNKKYFDYEYIRQISVTRVLQVMSFKTPDDIMKIASETMFLFLFKILFKKTNPEDYYLFVQNAMPFDWIILEILNGSFSESLDTISFNLYCDFKTAIDVMLKTQKQSFALALKLEKIGVKIPLLVDMLFLQTILTSNKKLVIDFRFPELFYEKFKTIIEKENFDIRTNLNKVILMVKRIWDIDCYFGDIVDFRRGILPILKGKHDLFFSLTKKIKSLNLSESDVQVIIKESFTKNTDFINKARSLFASETEDNSSGDEKSTQLLIENNKSKIISTADPSDVFFDVLRDLTSVEQEKYKEDKKPLDSLTSMQIYVNQLSYNAVQTLMFKKNLKNDLNTIYEMDFIQFKNYLANFVSLVAQEAKELYEDLSELIDHRGFSWTTFIQFILVTNFWENPVKLQKKITDFMREISSLVFENKKDVFLNKVVENVLDNVASFFPNAYYAPFFHNFINSSQKNRNNSVISAVIDLDNTSINVTKLCNKHFYSHLFVTGKTGILFGFDFCQELAAIFDELLKSDVIAHSSFTQFTLSLEVQVREMTYLKSLKFRIGFGPPIHIICQNLNVVNFEEDIGEASFIPEHDIDKLFVFTPLIDFFNYKMVNVSLKGFIGKTVSFSLIFGDSKVIDFEFVIGLFFEEKSSLNQRKWQFAKNSKSVWTDNLGKQTIQVHFAMLVIPFLDIISYIETILFEFMDENQSFAFLSTNSEKIRLLDDLGAKVDITNSIFERSKLKNLQKENQIGKFTVIYE